LGHLLDLLDGTADSSTTPIYEDAAIQLVHDVSGIVDMARMEAETYEILSKPAGPSSWDGAYQLIDRPTLIVSAEVFTTDPTNVDYVSVDVSGRTGLAAPGPIAILHEGSTPVSVSSSLTWWRPSTRMDRDVLVMPAIPANKASSPTYIHLTVHTGAGGAAVANQIARVIVYRMPDAAIRAPLR